MFPSEPKETDTCLAEKRAKNWDRLVSCVIVMCLFIPLPFVRLETWPQEKVLLEKPVTPWSRFRICYTSFPSGESVEDVFGFTWKGKIVPHGAQISLPFPVASLGEPSLKWQKDPEIPLSGVSIQGDFIDARTFWQPLLFSPLRMIWQTCFHRIGESEES